MSTYTVILVRLNERKTIIVEAMSYPGARNGALEQFPSWEIWLVTRNADLDQRSAAQLAALA